MDNQISSCMRYFESVHSRFLSKLPPPQKGVPTKKLMNQVEDSGYNNRYIWLDEHIADITRMRADGVAYATIGQRFGCSQTTIKNLCKKLQIKSPRCSIPSLKLERPALKP